MANDERILQDLREKVVVLENAGAAAGRLVAALCRVMGPFPGETPERSRTETRLLQGIRYIEELEKGMRQSALNAARMAADVENLGAKAAALAWALPEWNHGRWAGSEEEYREQ